MRTLDKLVNPIVKEMSCREAELPTIPAGYRYDIEPRGYNFDGDKCVIRYSFVPSEICSFEDE